jgi:hypothetical protein
MTDMSFVDALKKFRREAHVNQGGWKAIVVCNSVEQIVMAWDEAKFIFEKSSHKIKEARHLTRVITLENGASIRFAIVTDDGGDFVLSGLAFTHIIWLYEPKPVLFAAMEARKRSVDVKVGLRTDIVHL